MSLLAPRAPLGTTAVFAGQIFTFLKRIRKRNAEGFQANEIIESKFAVYGSIVNTFSHNLKFIRHYINVRFGGGDRLTDVPLTCDKHPRKMVKKKNGTKAVKKIFALAQFDIVNRKILVKSPSDTPTVIEWKSTTFSQS